MSELIDLSGPLYPGMWSYNVLASLGARLPDFAVTQLAGVRDHGFEAFRFELSSITGTYLETGRHMLAAGPLLSDLAPADFVRPAVVCHVPCKQPEELIHAAELAERCPPIQPGDALLVDCGWGNQWHAPNFVTHSPAFHHDCLPWLLEQPISILGVDVPCIETARSRPDGTESAGNMLIPLFEKGILLLAPVVNLDQIRGARGELSALPLNVQNVSGAPCRATFKEE